MRFEIYPAADGWRWRLCSTRNRKVLADGGEAYASSGNVRRAIGTLVRGIANANMLRHQRLSSPSGRARPDPLPIVEVAS